MTKLADKLFFKGLQAKQKVSKLLKNERGEANIIAIVIILAIVIALAIVFRTQIKSLFDKVWLSLFGEVDSALGSY